MVVFYIILFIRISNSSNPFETSRTCSNIFGNCASDGINDTATSDCSGIQVPGGGGAIVSEVYINQTVFLPNSAINATCQFYQAAGDTNYEYMWYYNKTNWISIKNWTDTNDGTFNRSAVFKVNSSEGEHIVRCILSWGTTIAGSCANSGDNYDNDDVNFTVTDYPKYDSWNMNVSDYTEVNRSEAILAYAHWDKNISLAQIRHNGTGSFENYTISSYEGNWANYTLDITNVTEFSKAGVIEISYIWANDTYGLENYTSPAHYFNLSAGNAPNITNFWFEYNGDTLLSNKTNLYQVLIITANVSDDIGLSTVIANITYPNGKSTNATMTGDTSPNIWQTWSYTFGTDLHLNTTGNYTVRITARDIGGQEKASGVDYTLENITLQVFNNYTLNLTSNYSVYNRGENVTIQALDVNSYRVDDVNWTVNVTKITDMYNFTPQATTFNYTILPSDPEGNYSMIANASKNNNTGNATWQFNVSKTLTLTITTLPSSSPPRSTLVNVTASLSNARDGLYTSLVNANVTCTNTMYPLTFSSGYATSLCTSPTSYGTSFNITVNVSDNYNNTGENYITLTTEAAPSTGGGGGGGGGGFATTPTKKCSDGTLYNQCSSERPIYCSNGTLINYCSVCGCNPGYGCQPDGSCVLTKEEDFNFILDKTGIEINQGEDAEIKGSLTNTGNTILNLISYLTVSENCCNVSVSPTFELREKEEKEFIISIHVPLPTEIKKYNSTIGIGTELVKKEKIIDITVTKSPYYNSLSDMEAELTNLENEIQDYKKAGIDVWALETLIGQSKTLLYNANNSMSSDQIDVLVSSLSDLKNNINYATSSLTLLRTQRFLSQNGWLIALLIISSILTIYLVPEVLIPLYKVENEIRKLKDEEKVLVSSRIETEKQYFMRKIDENTFSKIMIMKQDKILKARAGVKEKEEETKKIIENRLKPRGILINLKEKIKSIPKVFKKKNEI
jgi:hypothetical protein